MNIQSNSQQESNYDNLKTRIRRMCDEHDAERLIEDIAENSKLLNIDINKYSSAILDSISGKEIKSPFPYLKKVAWTIANEKHSELERDYLPNFTELHLKFSEIGMTGEEWEKYLIDKIITHCLMNFPIKTSDMIETIKAIVDYCVSRKTLTYRDYIRFLMASKIVKKCAVPLTVLEEKAKSEFEEINKIIEGVSIWQN